MAAVNRRKRVRTEAFYRIIHAGKVFPPDWGAGQQCPSAAAASPTPGKRVVTPPGPPFAYTGTPTREPQRKCTCLISMPGDVLLM